MDVFSGKETEVNWSKRRQILASLNTTCREGNVINVWTDLRPYYFNVLDCCQSARTQLGREAINLIGTIASPNIEDYTSMYSEPTLMIIGKLCGVVNKVIGEAAAIACQQLFAILPWSKSLSKLTIFLNERNVQLRERVTGAWLRVFRGANVELVRQNWLELKLILYNILNDSSPTVRQHGAEIFITLKSLNLELTHEFIEELDSKTALSIQRLLSRYQALYPKSPPETINNDFTNNDVTNNDFINDDFIQEETMTENVCLMSQEEGTRDDMSDDPTIGTASLVKDSIESEEDEVIIPMQAVSLSPEKSSNEWQTNSNLRFCTPFRKRLAIERVGQGKALSIESILTLLTSSDGGQNLTAWKQLEILISAQGTRILNRSRILAILSAATTLINSQGVLDGFLNNIIEKILMCLLSSLEITFILEADTQPLLFAVIHGIFLTGCQIDEGFLSCLLNHTELFEMLLEDCRKDERFAMFFMRAMESLLEKSPHIAIQASSCPPSTLLCYLYLLWMDHAQKNTEVTRWIIAVVTRLRIAIGETAFYEALPSLSAKQRNILNAYLTMLMP